MDLVAEIPRRREAVDCFNCSASCRPCDRTRHRCHKCAQISEMCQGYPRELQWLTGVTSRGKQKGQSLSIKPSSQEWESTTPTNHTFIFKPERPHKTRKQAPQSPKTRSAHKAVTRQSRLITAGDVQQPHQQSPVEIEASFVAAEGPCYGASSTATNICDSNPFDAIFADLDCSFIQDFSDNDVSMLSLPLLPHPLWQGDVDELLSLESEPPLIPPPPSISALPDLGPTQLLAFCK